jgi:Cys-tRNA synthase (O-phospho-L-seryl-tRNA:Cys-tRNA synthase)
LTEDDFMTRLEERGVKFLSRGSCQFRMVTHHGITAEEIDLVVEILKDVVG